MTVQRLSLSERIIYRLGQATAAVGLGVFILGIEVAHRIAEHAAKRET